MDRVAGNSGVCGAGDSLVVSSVVPHFGEEPPLTGSRGAGAVFFSRCNLKCLYCQNHEISWEGRGRLLTPLELAEEMIRLQEAGCHNIDLVSPTHVVPPLLDAIDLAAGMGLVLPLVYNTGGYDSLEVLRLLDGVVDIYLPDMKYATGDAARRLSGVPDYPRFNQAAVKEMFRQVGPLRMDEEGIDRRGGLVRHLVLPVPLHEPELVEAVQDPPVFIGGEGTVHAFHFPRLEDRMVLAHQAHRRIKGKLVPHEFQDGKGLRKAARQDQMADQDPSPGDPLLVHPQWTHLPEHLLHRRLVEPWIIRDAG